MRPLTLWHVEVAHLLIIMINLGSLNLVKVYTVLRKDFSNNGFVLTHHLISHHLIWISVHNCISWIIQVIWYRWSIVRIERCRICVRKPIGLNSPNKIQTLANIWLIWWHISIVLWTVTHCSECSCILICLHTSVVRLYLVLLKPWWTILCWQIWNVLI